MFDYQPPITAQFCGSLTDEMIKLFEDTAHAEISAAIGYNIAKEELKKCLAYDRHQYEKGYQDGKAEAKLGTGWISVKERLPEKDSPYSYSDDVIVTDGKKTSIGYYSYPNESWFDYYGDISAYAISHWLPIPRLPEEGNEDDQP